MAMKTKFPHVHNHGKAKVADGEVTYTFLDSHSRPQTVTKPLLQADRIVQMTRERLSRFKSAPPGARESKRSRKERKYVAAQPMSMLRKAFTMMSEELRMEFDMMLDMSSHHGISDTIWAHTHARPQKNVVGDDKEEL